MTVTEILTEEDPFLVPIGDVNHAVRVKGTINDMLSFCKDLVVNNEGSYKKITSLYKQAREWKKTIEAKREELVKPFQQ